MLYTNAGPKIQPFQGGFLCVNTIAHAARTGDKLERVLTLRRSLLHRHERLRGRRSLGGNPAPFLSVRRHDRQRPVVGSRLDGTTGSFLSDAVQYTICP